MGLGNGNAKQGDRGSNHSFEHRNLLSLGNIAAFVGAGATEATLQLVLAAIQSGSEFEARLVEDSDVPPVTWLEVRTWNTSSGTWNPPTYYPAGSNTPGTPTGAVTYINNSSVLATIASNTTGLATEATLLIIDTVLDAIKIDTANLDVALSTRATEATLAALNAKFNSLGQKASAASAPVVLSTEQEALIDGIETLLATIDADTSNLDVALSTRATEATLLATNVLLTTIDTVLDNILIDTGLIETAVTSLNTPDTGLAVGGPTRVTGVGTVTAGKRRVSIFNAGNAAADVNGGTNNLEKGESITWSADGLRDTLGAISYDGTGTTLVITTVG